MGKHVPSSIWSLRRPVTYPQAYVMTYDKDSLLISHCDSPGAFPGIIVLTRSDAKLLARRITQCLEATRG